MTHGSRISLILLALLLGALAARGATIQPTGAAAPETTLPTFGPPARYALVLNGAFVGWMQYVEGGQPYADVIVNDKPGSGRAQSLGPIKYEDITLQFGTDSDKSLDALMAGALNEKLMDGEIVTTDINHHVLSRLRFVKAQVISITFPALDTTSKDVALFTVTLRPERTETEWYNPPLALPRDIPYKQGTQNQGMAANFRLTINGLEDATATVNTIEAITITFTPMQTTGAASAGGGAPVTVFTVSPLIFTFDDAQVKPINLWFRTFLSTPIPNNEKEGKLEYLSADQKQVLFTLEPRGLGIYHLDPILLQAGSTAPVMYDRAQLFIGVLGYYIPPSPSGSTPTNT